MEDENMEGWIFGFQKSNTKPIKVFWGLYKITGDR
jgi:hypothetical protein